MTYLLFKNLKFYCSVFEYGMTTDLTTNFLSLTVKEPIQSRCAVLRYSKLNDAQLLSRLLEVVKAEDVRHTDDGLEAVIFTAQGDMRQVRGTHRLLELGFLDSCNT